MFAFQYNPAMMRNMGCNCDSSLADVDIRETKDSYILNIEIPGAAKEDVKMWVDDNILTISGEKKKISAEGQTELLSERSFGKFERAFRLPKSIDKSNIKAEFVNGVLIVSIPKSAQAKPVEVSIN